MVQIILRSQSFKSRQSLSDSRLFERLVSHSNVANNVSIDPKNDFAVNAKNEFRSPNIRIFVHSYFVWELERCVMKWKEMRRTKSQVFSLKRDSKNLRSCSYVRTTIEYRNSICVCVALLYIGRTKRLFQNLKHLNAKFLFGKCNKLTCRRSECEEIFCILSSNPFSMNQIPHECNSIC